MFIKQSIFSNSVRARNLSSNKLIESSKIFKNVVLNWKKDLLNFPVLWKFIDMNEIVIYKPFFILNHLIKWEGKFRWLLKDIISEPIFLIFSYLAIKYASRNIMKSKINFLFYDINVEWFLNFSKKLKFGNFIWNADKRFYISKKRSGFKFLNISSFWDIIVEQAIYIVFEKIYKNNLIYFTEKLHGFKIIKFCHIILKEIKFGWQNVNWYIKFNIKKSFNFVNRNKFVNLLKKEIQDQNLFLLLFQLFKVKTLFICKILRVNQNFVVMQNNILSLFFLNIYLNFIDFYVKNLVSQYNKKIKFKQNFKYIKANIHFKNKFEIQLEKAKFKSLSENKFEKINNLNLNCMKYLRYFDIFVIGVSTKKLAIKLKSKVKMWIESDLRFEVNEKKTESICICNAAVSLLGIKIRYVKIKNLLLIKSKAIEKKLRIMNRIKIKKNIINNKISKNVADLTWNRYRNKWIEAFALMKNLNKRKNKNFESEIIEILKIQNKQAIYFLGEKLIEVAQNKLNFDPFIKSIFKNILYIRKILVDLKIVKKKLIEKFKTFKLFSQNKFIVNQIIIKYGKMLNIIFFDSKYFCDDMNRHKFKFKWPKKFSKYFKISNKILFKVFKQSINKKRLYFIINYLEKNQFKISFNNEVVENNQFLFSQEKILSQATETIKTNKRFIILADLSNIYKKFWENSILKLNKMKACVKSEVLSCKEYSMVAQFKIIASGFLNYYYYCKNFFSVKSIINCFVKQSLILTLKHKYKVIYLKNGNRIEITKYFFKRLCKKLF